ncbi:hypothetical protein MTBBW1_420031 [Desulfamplus magnetovallimortis]|uniref:Uncharacterized protein n=1 Tax=Desulfamplus magnetovallimortis TaxID=1246637 RepID=A0A1W1HH44_9BACT|nr:hypothetical protein MTBBW1_420031 [Desulfamplus magnetovallimortis]
MVSYEGCLNNLPIHLTPLSILERGSLGKLIKPYDLMVEF